MAMTANPNSNLSSSQRHSRYEQVMGDSEPRVTDKKFVQELQHKLEVKYFESQRAKEKQLAEAEKKRSRKLALEGAGVGGEKRKPKETEKPQEEWKEFWPPDPNKTLEEYEEERRRAEEEKQQQGKAAAAADSNYDEDFQDDEAADAAAEPEAGAEGGDGDAESRGSKRASRFPRAISARIRDLYEEESLDELYAKAAGIVCVTTRAKAK